MRTAKQRELFERDQDDFGKKLATVLSPSHTIQSAEQLRGRDTQLAEIRQAFYSPGRQVFIYGYRGVGKSSLAQTAAFERQSSDASPILISCSADSTCNDIVQAIAGSACPNDPRLIKQSFQVGGKLATKGFGLELVNKLELGQIPKPGNLTEAIKLLEFVAATHSLTPVVIIDEFDLLTNKKEQENFANLGHKLIN